MQIVIFSATPCTLSLLLHEWPFTIHFLYWFWITQYVATNEGHKPDRSIWTKLQRTYCPSTHNTKAFHPIPSGWRIRIQNNSSKWRCFISFVTSEMRRHTRHKHCWNSALTVHFAQGPRVSMWSTVLKFITRDTGNAFTAFKKPQPLWKVLFTFAVLWSTIMRCNILPGTWTAGYYYYHHQLTRPTHLQGRTCGDWKKFQKKDSVETPRFDENIPLPWIINTLRTGSFKLFKRPFLGFLTILTL